jgi:hypothetical protein
MSEFPDPDYQHFSICKKNVKMAQHVNIKQLYAVLSAMDKLSTKKDKPLIRKSATFAALLPSA